MSDLDDIMNLDIGDFGDTKRIPDGWYEGPFMGFTPGVIPNEKKTRYVDLHFLAEEPLDGQDMEGVQGNRRVSMRVWLSEKSMKYVPDKLRSLGVKLPKGETLKGAGTFGLLLDGAVNNRVKFKVALDERALERGKEIPVAVYTRQAA